MILVFKQCILKKNGMQVLSSYKGVTLIELLVVITIMMTMITLVAPLAINTVDKAEAQSEYLSFCGILRRASVKAFANGSGINITLDQNTLVAFIVPKTIGSNSEIDSIEKKMVVERTFEYLNFSSIELSLPATLRYTNDLSLLSKH